MESRFARPDRAMQADSHLFDNSASGFTIRQTYLQFLSWQSAPSN